MRNRNFERGGSRKNGTRRVRKFWIVCAWILSISMILGTGNAGSYIVDADDEEVPVTEVPSETAETETQESAAPVLSATPEPVSTETYVPEAAPAAATEATAEPSPTAVPSPSIAPVSEVTAEPAAYVSSEASPSATPYASMEPSASPEATASAEPSPAASPVGMPAVSFEDTEETTGIKVSVKAEEGTFPEGTTMELSPVTDENVLNDAMDASSLEHAEAKAVDITFKDAAGNVIEPEKQIRVTMTADVIKDAETVDVVHVPDEKEKEEDQSVETEVVDQTADADLKEDEKPAEDQVVFDADQFSVYAIVYTVNFDYGEHTLTITGGESIKLSDVLNSLQIVKDTDGNVLTIEDVADAVFSNPELISVTKQDVDWVLHSENPFDTNETLTLTLTNGDTLSIEVTDDSAVDLSKYISKVSVKKNVNGYWVETTEFKVGDSIQVSLEYSIKSGEITISNKTAVYHIPGGIVPSEGQSGNIRKDGKNLGTYTIGTDGTITLNFNDDFAKEGLGVDGKVSFEGTLSETKGGGSGSITFPGTSNTITVEKPVEDLFDIHTNKTGSVSSDNKVTYTVTATTNNGTGNEVTITDQYGSNESENVSSFSYDHDSLKIKKIDANGSSEEITNYKINFTTVNSQANGDPKFEISGLPALNAGERYEVTYDVNISPKDATKRVHICNLAYSKSGNHDEWHWDSEDIETEIEKEGGYDSETNTFWWRIKLNNGFHQDVSNWKVHDSGTGTKIVGNVSVYRVENNNPVFVSSRSDFDGAQTFEFEMGNLDVTDPNDSSKTVKFSALSDDQKKADYYIEYRTEAPAGQAGGQVSEKNSAGYTDKDNHGKDTSSTATGNLRDSSVNKTWKDNSDQLSEDKSTLQTQWNSDVILPAGKLNTFSYEDVIEDAVDDQGKTYEHYAIASELENAFKKIISSNSDNGGNCKKGLYLALNEYDRYNYNGSGIYATKSNYYDADAAQSDIIIKVTYFDKDGNEVLADNSSTPVKSFTVTISSKNGIEAHDLAVNGYPTHVNVSQLAGGQGISIKNKGLAGGKESEASHKYVKPMGSGEIDKRVHTSTVNGGRIFKNGSQTVDYSLDDGKLIYKLMLHTVSDGTLTIHDTLPDGVTYVDKSIKAFYYQDATGNENNRTDKIDWSDGNEINVNFSTNAKPEVTTSPDGNGKTVLIITIPNFKYAKAYPYVGIEYSVSFAGDNDWKNPATTSRTYTNTAEWNGKTSSDEVTVTRDKVILNKSSVQLDEDGNPIVIGSDGKPIKTPAGEIRYSIVINAAADDLVKNSETLTLVDTVQKGNPDLHPYLDLSSVHLYNYSSNAENHIGTEILQTSYELQYDETNNKMTLVIPDGKALVLVYDYRIDENAAGTPTISNSAELNGKWSASENTKVETSTSSATADHKKITVYKVDSSNYKELLSGAAFNLERYDYNKDQNSGSWMPIKQQVTTGKEGTIVFNLSGSNPELETDKLYRLTETTAPDGYKLDTTPHYFIWKDESDLDNNGAYANANVSSAQINNAPIKYIENGGGDLYISNDYTRLSVIKSWAKNDGSAARMPEGVEVKVQLYKEEHILDGKTVTIKMLNTSSNNYEYYSGSYVVENNSSLTVSVNAWKNDKWQGPLYLTYGGQSHEMSYGSDGNWTGKIDSVTDNMEIDISAPWQTNAPTVDYTLAPTGVINKTPVGDPVALINTNGSLSYHWDKLPTSDNNKQLYYSVEEVSVKKNNADISGNYQVSYRNNDGIQSGQIIITNTNNKEVYELPETGGSGTKKFILSGFGLVLIGISSILMKKKNMERMA